MPFLSAACASCTARRRRPRPRLSSLLVASSSSSLVSSWPSSSSSAAPPPSLSLPSLSSPSSSSPVLWAASADGRSRRRLSFLRHRLRRLRRRLPLVVGCILEVFDNVVVVDVVSSTFRFVICCCRRRLRVWCRFVLCGSTVTVLAWPSSVSVFIGVLVSVALSLRLRQFCHLAFLLDACTRNFCCACLYVSSFRECDPMLYRPDVVLARRCRLTRVTALACAASFSFRHFSLFSSCSSPPLAFSLSRSSSFLLLTTRR